MKHDDTQLIQRVLAGDDIAFSVLVRKYQKPVHALAWRKIGDFHIAEEITQDTFLKAYQKLAMLKEPQRFLSWLYVIATNLCKAWLRKKRLRTESLENTESIALEKATYSGYVISENERTAIETQREVVKKLLAKLQESERTIVTLRYFSEMSSAEIGEFLGISANTVRSRLRRAQERLKKEEPMIREALEHFHITPNLTENIMREVSRLKPVAPSGGKPFVPWVIGVSTLAVVLLMLGIGNQHLSRFQKPYSFDATSEMTVEIIEAPIVLNLEAKPDVRTQIGSFSVSSKNDRAGQQPDDVLFAAAQAEGEDVSIPKQQWIQAEPLKGSDATALSVTSDGELYTVADEGIYKMGSGGKAWQQITDINTLDANYRRAALIEKWNDTLYLLVNNALLASKDDGKTWELVHRFPIDYGLFAFDLELTQQAFYIIFSDSTAFRSEDNGQTWKAVNVGFPERPNAMVVFQDTLFAGTGNGLYRLKDNNWERVEFPVPVGEILAIATTDGKIYVAAKYSQQRTSFQKVRQGEARGWWIFRSTDSGASWDDITPTNAWQVMGLPPEIKLVATGETLLAMERGMVRSTDGGDTWLPRQLPGTSPSMDRFSSAVVVNDNTIYVGSSDGLYRSTDAGISWDAVNINRQNRSGIYNLIAYKGQNMPPTLYAMFGGEIVKTTNNGKSWRTIQMGTPMTASVREELPTFTQIREFGGILYAKTMGSHSPGNEHKTGLYRISADSNTVMLIQDMPIFDSDELSRFWNIGRTGALDVSGKSFLEHLKGNFVGADQFFKTLTQGGTFRQEELYKQDLYQDQIRLIRRGINGAFAVSGNTFYVEYNFKLFRWKLGETEWYDTGVEETGELLYREAMKAFEGAGMSVEKIDEILSTWLGFTFAVSGNTIYVGKRDGHLVASFDMGNNWLDLTPALPFPVKAFKTIVFVGSTVYVATDAGVAASNDGKQWRAVTNAAGTRLNMEQLTVAGDTLYGFIKNTGIYRLESGTWEPVISEMPDHVEGFAVGENTLYVNTRDGNMLHFKLKK
ncbi:sigma-70 family RNA polymerase sigma factor [Candidatus Poribacteria bacterium]|nr:sigma-70 family RNA polymerase sigma factor [Candidatus Poribacteria bacterium]